MQVCAIENSGAVCDHTDRGCQAPHSKLQIDKKLNVRARCLVCLGKEFAGAIRYGNRPQIRKKRNRRGLGQIRTVASLVFGIRAVDKGVEE